MDALTRQRVRRFVSDFRTRTGQLPTLKDFAAAGFDKKAVERCVRDKVLQEMYVTLTNGVIVKGYKVG